MVGLSYSWLANLGRSCDETASISRPIQHRVFIVYVEMYEVVAQIFHNSLSFFTTCSSIKLWSSTPL